MQPLQILAGIPGAQLRVEWVGLINSVNHPCITQWLKQHGQLISHLTLIVHVSDHMLKLREFSEAAAPCRSIDLAIRHFSDKVVDLADLDPVAGSLKKLRCEAVDDRQGTLRGASALNSMSQLTALYLGKEEFGSEEPWDMLAKLTSLQQLSLGVSANGDPSPLSALTGLSSLHIASLQSEAIMNHTPFSFTSLQPLSTLQHLEELTLCGYACDATCLQGLAGLSSLKQLNVESCYYDGLASLEGISPGLLRLFIRDAKALASLFGIEGCTSMERLSLNYCGVSCLQPLTALGTLMHLEVFGCSRLANLKGLSSTALETLVLIDCNSLTHLSGVEHFSALKSLEVTDCGVTSLQPLSQLGEGLRELRVDNCRGVQEEVLELPNVHHTANVVIQYSNVKEVVLAGGVRRACIDGGDTSGSLGSLDSDLDSELVSDLDSDLE
jgi:hypothetical protein